MTFDLWAYGPLLLKAAGTTIWLSWLALLIGAIGGTLVALARTSRFLALHRPGEPLLIPNPIQLRSV